MNWHPLVSVTGIDEIRKKSLENPQVIFKHSTRCSISVMALNRLEKSEFPPNISFHYLDLLNYREVSNKIAEDFDVAHESPQVLIIKNGICTFVESHNGILADEIIEQASN